MYLKSAKDIIEFAQRKLSQGDIPVETAEEDDGKLSAKDEKAIERMETKILNGGGRYYY